jgi:serine/threonine-protein kinase
MRPVEANATHEIEDAVQKALVAAGIAGTVTLTGRTLSLRAGGAPIEIDALYLVEQWPLLPPEMRERKAADVAMRLADASRAARAGVPAPAASRPRVTPSVRPTGKAASGPGKPIVLPIGTVLLLIAAAALAWLWFRAQRPAGESGSAASSAHTTPDNRERESRLCEAARTTLLNSQKLPQIDAQVWLVELWLATSKPGDDLGSSKAFTDLVDVAKRKLTAAADPDLAALPVADVEIVRDEPRGAPPYRAIVLRFTGGYVSKFFDKEGREQMIGVARKLADGTGAELGAFYARCPHLPYHDIGAWFRGATPAHASAALVYSMGFFSERATNHDPNVPPSSADLPPLLTALSKLEKSDKAAFEGPVREARGTWAPGVGASPTVIAFQLFGPRDAARAATLLAKSAGMGPDIPRPAATR